MKYFIGTIIGIVTLSVIIGIVIVGSPQETRLRRFDEQRIHHLQTLQSEIVYYWQQKSTLPQVLTDLVDPLRGFVLPKDPVTNEEYEYSIQTDVSFSLCATFQRKSQLIKPVKQPITRPYDRPIFGDTWDHEMGRVCFQRSIDKDFYGGAKAPLRVPPVGY